MIRSLYRAADATIRFDLQPEGFRDALRDAGGLLWVDFEGTAPEEDRPILRDTFGFHPLAVDDALDESHVPKIDDWGEYLYIVLHAVVIDRQRPEEIDSLEVDVFLGKNYIVTHHDKPVGAIEHMWSHCQRDQRYVKNGADHLLYRLADEMVASYMPVVEEMDDTIDALEDQIFDRPTPATLERLFTLKRSVIRMRRILGPQREALNKLARDNYQVIDARDRIYFRDVYDHIVRLHDITEGLRDVLGGALDTYLSVINNRMNDIVKTLTTITTLFMPVSFVVGFFGMNFFRPAALLDAWTTTPAFVVTLLALLLTPIVMYVWMRRRGWM
jgi:magnesium transporter